MILLIQGSRRWLRQLALAAVLSLGTSGAALAGPFILDLTDADDHGFASGGVNNDGWLYMQRVLENLAPGVTNGNTTVVSLGSSFTAAIAAQSAFNGSTLAGSGWNWVNVDGETALTGFFDGTGATTIADAGIITIDSGFNVSGGIGINELDIINTFATTLDSWLGGGGGLHSMAESSGSSQYGWLSTLLPGLSFTSVGGTGLFLTGDGSAAFPGLTDSDLSSGPFHGAWTGGLGGLTVLFADAQGRPVGIGSSGGSVTDPDPPSTPVPAPGTAALLLAGLSMLSLGRRRRS